MKLYDYVIYREYGRTTVIYNVKSRLAHLTSSPIKFILDLMRTDTTSGIIKGQLVALYPDTSKDIIDNDVDAVTAFLMENGLLENSLQKNKEDCSLQSNIANIQKYTITENILFSAMFELTYRCPEKCIHCYLEPEKNASSYCNDVCELTTSEIYNVIDQLRELNVMEITFTGGEPFIRKDFFEILEYANSKDFAINIYSNAILLNDEDILRLKKLKIASFHTSIYSSVAEEHDSITGVKGSFQKTVENLKKLAELNIHITIKFVLMEKNKKSFPGVISLANSLNASIRLISGVSPSTEGNTDICSLNVNNFDELVDVIKLYNSEIGYSGPDTAFSEKHPICEAGRNNLTVRPDGEVTPCNAFDYKLGNVKNMSVENIWNSQKLKQWQGYTKENLSDCKDCKYATWCSFCPGCAMHHSGNMFKKYDAACRQAAAQFEALK